MQKSNSLQKSKRGMDRFTACECMLSHFSHVWLLATLWTIAHQAPLSTVFSRQEYWSGLLCPPPGDLSHPEVKPMSLTSPALSGGFFTNCATWEALTACNRHKFISSLGRKCHGLNQYFPKHFIENTRKRKGDQIYWPWNLIWKLTIHISIFKAEKEPVWLQLTWLSPHFFGYWIQYQYPGSGNECRDWLSDPFKLPSSSQAFHLLMTTHPSQLMLLFTDCCQRKDWTHDLRHCSKTRKSGFLWLSGKEFTCQCRRQGFNPWPGKIPDVLEQLSPCTTSTEPGLWSPGATTTEPRCSNYCSLHALKSVLHNKRSHRNEKSGRCN